MKYNGNPLGLAGKLIQARHSSKAIAILFENKGLKILAVEYQDKEVKTGLIIKDTLIDCRSSMTVLFSTSVAMATHLVARFSTSRQIVQSR